VLAGRPQWRKACDVVDEVTGFAFRGDELYLQTTRDAANAKYRRRRCQVPTLPAQRPVVPEGQIVIEGIGMARDGLYVRDMDVGTLALRRLGNDGKLQSVKLPSRLVPTR